MRPKHGGNLAWAAAIARCAPEAILDFSASISPLGPPKSAIAAIQAHLNYLNCYPNPDYRELRTAIGQLHQLPLEWILPGNGSAELLTWAGWDLAQCAVTSLVTPAFGDYWRCLKAFKAKVQPQPLNLSPSGCQLALSNRISSSESGLLLNNPHNPTGYLLSRERIRSYLEQYALVVVDEAFMDFLPATEEQSLIPVIQEYPNLVILRSLTKFYSLPGLRLGYAIAHPDRLHRWQQWRDPWPVNVLAAAAGIAAIQDKEFQQQTLAWLPSARLALFSSLAKVPWLQPYPSAANFLLVESEKPSSQIQQMLLERHRLLIRDCLSFPELGEGYFRVAVRSLADNQRLVQGIEEIESKSN